MESASESRGEEEIELMVQLGGRMRVSVLSVRWDTREGKSEGEAAAMVVLESASWAVSLEVAVVRAL